VNGLQGNKMRLKAKKILSVVFIAGGIMLLLYPLSTYLYSKIVQWSMLRSAEVRVEEPFSTASGQEVSVPSVTVPESSSKVAKGFSEAILEIPAIKLTTVVLKGTSQDVLAKAPGWYEESAPPGQGNTAIAGHLNTNGRWFRNIEKLKPGEEIILKYEGHVYLYAVEKVFPVQSTDWSIIDPCGYNALTLTTCIANDRSRRLIVRARQVSVSPLKDIKPR
jgi:sortase A